MGVPAASPGSDPVELLVDRLAAGGRGVARAGGLVWFLPGGLPGDRVRATAVLRRPSYVEGRIVEVLAWSADRRPPPCPLQPRCGGCPWMGLEEADQRRWKRALVEDALRRIGRSAVEVEEVRASPLALGYRNKLELTLGRGADGRPAVGFHPQDESAGGLVDVDRCQVQTDPANAVLATAREFLLSRSADWAGAAERARDPYRLVIRASTLTGQVLVAIREVAGAFPLAERLAERLRERHADLAGVVRIRALSGRRGRGRTLPLVGRPWIEERVGGTTFRLPAATFLQVNPQAAELLLESVREAAGRVSEQEVIDLYGGVGLFGIALAREGARVSVCDADPVAVDCGRHAARAAGARRVAFHRADVTEFLRGRPVTAASVDLVVANPPRRGLGRHVPPLVAGLAPQRIILVSCDPATLARDAQRLARAGFTPERAIPVDLFPQTAHVETVLSLVRNRLGPTAAPA